MAKAFTRQVTFPCHGMARVPMQEKWSLLASWQETRSLSMCWWVPVDVVAAAEPSHAD